MRRRARFVLFLAIGCLIISAPQSHGGTITLGFTSLPSAQGWDYYSDPWWPSPTPEPESHFYWADGGILNQDTTDDWGTWYAPYYVRSTGIDFGQPFDVTFRARVLADSGIPGNDFGFAFSAMHAGCMYGLGLATTQLEGSAGEHLAFDATSFHDYRVSVTPGVGYNLYVDGAWQWSVAARCEPDYGALGDRLALGDLTRGRGARAELSSFEATNVPEPASLLLLGSGLAAAVRFARRRLG